jgi:outer membrane protein
MKNKHTALMAAAPAALMAAAPAALMAAASAARIVAAPAALMAAALVVLACLGTSGTAAAAPADDDAVYNNSLRVGAEFVFYHTKSNDLTGPYLQSNDIVANFKALDLQTVYVGYVRRVWSNFAVELALGYPPLSKVEGRGSPTVGSVPYAGQIVSSARWLSPTAFIEYNFLSDSSALRPYFGLGVNYTQFYDRSGTAAGNAAQGGPTRISLTASVGPAATAGLDWHIKSHWHAYASYSISQVDTHITTDTVGIERRAHLHFGPQVLVISGGYSF